MRILLGGTGVIGSAILRLLDGAEYHGKYKVILLVRKEIDYPVPDFVEIVKCDLANIKPEMLPDRTLYSSFCQKTSR